MTDKQAREQLEAADKIRTETNKLNAELTAKIEPMDRRIAELEAREVVVPDVSNDEFWMKFNGRIVFREETYRSAVFKALESAGVGIKG
ncbi:hypothetical protein HX362_003224 [Salmonella enterica]|nr:hypothetical protein [Salmonella enterica]